MFHHESAAGNAFCFRPSACMKNCVPDFDVTTRQPEGKARLDVAASLLVFVVLPDGTCVFMVGTGASPSNVGTDFDFRPSAWA